jgi:hypothetical protein
MARSQKSQLILTTRPRRVCSAAHRASAAQTADEGTPHGPGDERAPTALALTVTTAGEKVGKVEDLIISPDKSVSYDIVGAGGFVGIGRHDVAIPFAQIHDQAGKLVMPGGDQGHDQVDAAICLCR